MVFILKGGARLSATMWQWHGGARSFRNQEWPDGSPVTHPLLSVLGLSELIRNNPHLHGLVQDCSISSALALEIPQSCINTLRPRQNGRHFADNIFKCIFLNENVWIPIKISLKFVPKGPVNNIPALVQIMAWRRPGDKSLSEPMMVGLTTHICVTRPQWVKPLVWDLIYWYSIVKHQWRYHWISWKFWWQYVWHVLTHYGLVTPFCFTDLCQCWFR